MEFKPNKKTIGHCNEWDAEVENTGDPLLQHVDQCKYFELGKPKHDKSA